MRVLVIACRSNRAECLAKLRDELQSSPKLSGAKRRKHSLCNKLRAVPA